MPVRKCSSLLSKFLTIFSHVLSVNHACLNSNFNRYATFAALAFVILIGVLGVLAGNIYFWGAFTALHVLGCFFLSFQIYYLGRWRLGKENPANKYSKAWMCVTNSMIFLILDCGIFRRVYGRWKNDCLAGPLTCLRPLYIDRLILLIFANGCNWAIAAYGIHHQSPDFASHLLLIFMANLFIYTIFYIIMKLSHREKILIQPLSYISLTIVFWGLGLWIFLQKSTSWQTSPAELSEPFFFFQIKDILILNKIFLDPFFPFTFQVADV